MTTQWKARATGYGGDGNAATSFIDSLAEESIDFPSGNAASMGVFARAAFLTGMPLKNGVIGCFDSLPENAVTIAHRFQEGYNTAFSANGNCSTAIEMLCSLALNMRRLKFLKIVRGFKFLEGLSRAFFKRVAIIMGLESVLPPELRLSIGRSRGKMEPLFEF